MTKEIDRSSYELIEWRDDIICAKIVNEQGENDDSLPWNKQKGRQRDQLGD